MPVITVTTRYTTKFDNKPDYKALANNRKYLKRQFDPIGDIESEVITEGDPDGLGDLVEQQEFAIRSKIEVTDDKAAELRKAD